WSVKAVGPLLGLLLLVTVGLSFVRFLWRIFWGRFHHRVAEHLRNQIFTKLTELSPSFFQRRTVGDLMSLINHDVNQFRMAVGPGILILMDGIFILGIIPPIMIGISASLTWKTLILMPLVPFVVYRLLAIIHQRFRAQQDRFGEMSGVTQEIISGMRVIKSFAQEKNQLLAFNGFSRNYEVACNQVARPDALFAPSLETAVNLGSVILLLVGAPEVIEGKITIGQFFAFYQYIQRMVWPMTALGLGFNFIQKGKASFSRIYELLKSSSEVQQSGDEELSSFESLEIRNLTFTYPGAEAPALCDFDFHLRKGEVVALVGKTGSGKSTLIDVLCRFFHVPENKVFVNGVAIEKLRLSSLRKLMAVAPQVPFLFSRQIIENISYGEKYVDDSEIEDVLQSVSLEREIAALPDKQWSYIGERGVNLSGGQKQRLTMARAFLKKAPLLILDDALSAVDSETEQSLLQALRSQALDRQRSLLFVSNRISSLKWADRIVVVSEGRVEAEGAHEELMKSSPTYRQLYEIQTESEKTRGEQLFQ
ncbi:MAG: ABC transporter ATP-binding protein, partial [Bdellovibrionales bacterium]|nr:ABC transporter ATP-binding protein [Bdellovibrionales bacterium]